MKSPVWVVKEVQPKENYTLYLTFADGTRKVYNAYPLLEKTSTPNLKILLFSWVLESSAVLLCGVMI